MDPTRQIRLLIPPFFFFASILSAIFFSNMVESLDWIRKQSLPGLVGIVALIGIATVPLGFFFSTATHIFLRLFRIFGWNYENGLSEGDLNRIWPLLGTRLERDARIKTYITGVRKTSCETRHYVAATLDHGILYNHARGIQEWVMRAYTAFWVSACSVVALVLSLVVIVQLVCTPWEWWVWYAIVLVILLAGAFLARHDTLRMTEFQTYRMTLGNQL